MFPTKNLTTYRDRFLPLVNADNFYQNEPSQQTPQEKLFSYMETGQNPFFADRKVLCYKSNRHPMAATSLPITLNKIFHEIDRLPPSRLFPLNPTLLEAPQLYTSVDCSHFAWSDAGQLITLGNHLFLRDHMTNEITDLYEDTLNQPTFSPQFLSENTTVGFLHHNNEGTEAIFIDIETSEEIIKEKICDFSLYNGSLCVINNNAAIAITNRDLRIIDTRSPRRALLVEATANKMHTLVKNPKNDLEILISEEGAGSFQQWDLRKFDDIPVKGFSCLNHGTIHSIAYHHSSTEMVAVSNITGEPLISIWDMNQGKELYKQHIDRPLYSLCWSSPEYRELLGTEGPFNLNTNGKIKVWNYDPYFQLKNEQHFGSGKGDIIEAHINPENTSLATIHLSNTIQIWEKVWPEKPPLQRPKRQRTIR